jgi:Tfp pilus assembly protein PilP
MSSRKVFPLVLIFCFGFISAGSISGEEPIRTPSEKMKEAVGKLNKAPATIGQSLQGLRDAAAANGKQTLGGDSKAGAKSEPVDLSVPSKTAAKSVPATTFNAGRRDPFRSPSMPKKATAPVRENLSPLEQKDLGQLKVVGIVWDIKEPRAMIEDTAGLGYTVKVGTAIGRNDGRVKVIQQNHVIVEEIYEDAYGARKRRDVTMKLAME